MDPLQPASARSPGMANAKDAAAVAAAERDQNLRKACADFEAVLTYQLLKSMRRTVPSLSELNKFPGKDTYDMMMDQKVAEDLSRRGNGLGIQDVLYRQLSGRKAP